MATIQYKVMIKRVKATKIGDVFEVKISDTEKKYMQYVVSDLTQLNSDVVRVFSKIYLIHEEPLLEDIVSGDVQFYVHCATKLGLKMKCWSLYGNIHEVGDYSNVIFRCSEDFANPQVKVSKDWYIWHINGSFIDVGKLPPKYYQSYIGVICSPPSVLKYVRTGIYQGVYPQYK